NEGQSATIGYLKYPDAFRVQSTIAGSVLCQAYTQGVGWLPEVNDSQVCGTFSGRSVGAMRLRLADAAAGMHVLYRCHLAVGLALTWTPWVADGTACGATGLNQPVTAIQVQLSDASLSNVTYRAHSPLGWKPWVDEGVVSGTLGEGIDGIEVHSNVGGLLKCQPYVAAKGWQNQVEDNALCGTVGKNQ